MANPLKASFLGWQCRVRQLAMREHGGRPDAAFMPAVTLAGQPQAMGNIITLMSKKAKHSKLPEMQHMYRQTADPAQRRSKALTFFSETYYQKPAQFSATLTSTFIPDSAGADNILSAGQVTLRFEAYNQRYDVVCEVRRLNKDHHLYQSTWWHNRLFNPNLHPETIIIAFKPDWSASSSGQVVCYT